MVVDILVAQEQNSDLDQENFDSIEGLDMIMNFENSDNLRNFEEKRNFGVVVGGSGYCFDGHFDFGGFGVDYQLC